MELEYAIKCLETGTKMPDFYASNEDVDEACKIACEAIKEKMERDNPQPLAEDEFHEMDGNPVWIQNLEQPEKSQWRLCHWDRGKYLVLQGICVQGYVMEEYGKAWIAYKYKPKEE